VTLSVVVKVAVPASVRRRALQEKYPAALVPGTNHPAAAKTSLQAMKSKDRFVITTATIKVAEVAVAVNAAAIAPALWRFQV